MLILMKLFDIFFYSYGKLCIKIAFVLYLLFFCSLYEIKKMRSGKVKWGKEETDHSRVGGNDPFSDVKIFAQNRTKIFIKFKSRQTV